VGLVAEVGASLDQLVHGDDRCRHNLSPSGYTSGNQELKRLAAAPDMSIPMWNGRAFSPDRISMQGLDSPFRMEHKENIGNK
jgi:hypothetical protein